MSKRKQFTLGAPDQIESLPEVAQLSVNLDTFYKLDTWSVRPKSVTTISPHSKKSSSVDLKQCSHRLRQSAKHHFKKQITIMPTNANVVSHLRRIENLCELIHKIDRNLEKFEEVLNLPSLQATSSGKLRKNLSESISELQTSLNRTVMSYDGLNFIDMSKSLHNAHSATFETFTSCVLVEKPSVSWGEEKVEVKLKNLLAKALLEPEKNSWYSSSVSELFEREMKQLDALKDDPKTEPGRASAQEIRIGKLVDILIIQHLRDEVWKDIVKLPLIKTSIRTSKRRQLLDTIKKCELKRSALIDANGTPIADELTSEYRLDRAHTNRLIREVLFGLFSL